MIYPHLEGTAIPKGPKAFSWIGEESSQSQAAVLLHLGRQLRGDDEVMLTRSPTAKERKFAREQEREDEAEFPVPRVGRAAMRISLEETGAELERRYAIGVRPARGALDPSAYEKALAKAGDSLYRDPTPARAAELMVLALRHPMQLPAVAAAAASFGLSTSPDECLSILRKGARSREPIVRDLAATVLARIAPEDPALVRLMRASPGSGGGKPAHTATIVHGTWAASESWWKPGGDFYLYVRSFRPDLYGARDYYRWSGGYSAAARALAASQLLSWVTGHSAQGLDLFTHSHGGSAAMLATQGGLQVGKLVLLSCPVHYSQYSPNFANVREAHSVRVKWDLVILADRGGQRFADPRIQEHVLPVWFQHSATHDKAIWIKHGVRAKIGM